MAEETVDLYPIVEISPRLAQILTDIIAEQESLKNPEKKDSLFYFTLSTVHGLLSSTKPELRREMLVKFSAVIIGMLEKMGEDG